MSIYSLLSLTFLRKRIINFTQNDWDMLDLQQEFKDVLYRKVPKRADLVKRIASILNIELESVSRRLSGRVQFSINEMAKIANELHISLDRLLFQGVDYNWIPIVLESPMTEKSIDVLADLINHSLDEVLGVLDRSAVVEYAFDTLPLVFALPYKNLLKFMYFKWGHYFVASDEFIDFGSWNIPSNLSGFEEKYTDISNNAACSTYIWSHSLIWNLVKEVEYFSSMDVITLTDKKLIMQDIHDLLHEIEISNRYGLKDRQEGFIKNFYICHVTLGINCWYYASENGIIANSMTRFSRTSLLNNPDSCHFLREWIQSLKKLSTLISGTGNIERRVFFNEQHNILDYYEKSYN